VPGSRPDVEHGADCWVYPLRECVHQGRIMPRFQELRASRDHADGVTCCGSAGPAQQTDVSLPCDVKAVVVRAPQRCVQVGEPPSAVRAGKQVYYITEHVVSVSTDAASLRRRPWRRWPRRDGYAPQSRAPLEKVSQPAAPNGKAVLLFERVLGGELPLPGAWGTEELVGWWPRMLGRRRCLRSESWRRWRSWIGGVGRARERSGYACSETREFWVAEVGVALTR